MEKAPRSISSSGHGFEVVHRHTDQDRTVSPDDLGMICEGDVIAFTMSHRQALSHLREGAIQKIPYELFRYGHLALVVENPERRGELRLLQVAMKQAVNTDEGLDYLSDKTWEVHRPPSGSVDGKRLGNFVQTVTKNASDPRTAYDYTSISGWRNAPWQPEEEDEIGDCFSCATLVISALHYSGFELDAVHRGGRLDLVTPRQVVESRGIIRED